MSYKTILLHLHDEQNSARLLAVACKLARRFEAHLIGLHVLPPIVLPPAIEVPYGAEIIHANRAAGEKQLARLHELFETTIANQPFVGEWRVLDANTSTVANIVSEQARAVDLTIVAQAGNSGAGNSGTGNNGAGASGSGTGDVVEFTAFESGRPVLVVPNAGQFDKQYSQILIAWNGRREAVRAVFDALPFLQAAQKVHILTVTPRHERGPDQAIQIPGAQIAATLARHGVNCEAAQMVSGDIGVGDTLLNMSAEQGIDLIVMGCYGHSRLREFVFGGATRTILAHMTAPVLMSH